MTALHVTEHAIDRYRLRVEPVSADVATERLSSQFIQRAAKFGAKYVRLGTGQHVVIEDMRVVTVLPADTWLGTFDPRRVG